MSIAFAFAAARVTSTNADSKVDPGSVPYDPPHQSDADHACCPAD